MQGSCSRLCNESAYVNEIQHTDLTGCYWFRSSGDSHIVSTGILDSQLADRLRN